MGKKKISVFLFFLIFLPYFLLAQIGEEQFIIEHTPISTFTHGETIKIEAKINKEVEWMRFFFRCGTEQFQVRNMKKTENNLYVFEFDTSKLPGLEFEYYLACKTKDKIIYLPSNVPQEFFKVTGKSEEPMPEIPEEFPSPEEEEKKIQLPFNINGSIENKIAEKEFAPDEKKTTASGNLRVFHTYTKGNFTVDFDSNFNYSNTPLPEEKSFDLSNMMLSISKASHTLRAGDININESEFTVYGLGRRGTEYVFDNQRAYFHLFDVSSQQPKGFKGFGIPKSNISIMGGAIGYKFFNDKLSLKAIYLSGKDDPNQGVNVGASDFYQKRKGNVFAVTGETNLFGNILNFKAEFARSNYDENLTDTIKAVSDNAFNIGGTFSYGEIGVITIGANYKYIGKQFNSIGYQYFTNDRKGLEANFGFTFKKFNLMTNYTTQQDNVENVPSENTTKDKNIGINLSLGISEKVSLNFGYMRNKQDTFQGEEKTSLQDSLTSEYTGGINFVFGQSANLNINLTNSFLSSENNPQSDTSTFTLNLGGSFRAGEIFSLTPSFSYSKVKNEFTNEETLTYNSFVTSELAFIPKVFSIVFSGSYNRTEIAPDNISNIFDLSGGFNFYLDELIKIGSIILSLNGNYKYMDTAGVTDSDYSLLFKCDFSF